MGRGRALAGSFAIVGVWWLYRREGRELSNSVRAILAALRLAILAIVVAMLCELVLVRTTTELVPSRLLVLTDTSQSMALADPYTDSAAAAGIASLGVVDKKRSPTSRNCVSVRGSIWPSKWWPVLVPS